MSPALRRTAFLFCAATWSLWPAVACADPLVFFLMTAAKQIAAAASNYKPSPEALPQPAPATTYPGTAVEPETLRRVIDDSFVYLSSAQRAEIFESLNAMLLDPKLGPTRATMIEYFLHKALAVRAAQMELARLSDAEKQRLAGEFRQETAGLSDEDRKQLLGLLEQHLLPVPADLNQMLLAQLQESR
ncbi:MAG: hypothetical protein JSS40_00570 [Proteobacteria bacterium]|nr:hypothetical protein [Pseudomonadota bacterium]